MEKDIFLRFEFDHSLVTAYIILLLLVLLFGFLANVLLCTTIWSNVSSRLTPSNMYVCTLATIHCIASVSAVLTVDDVLHNWTSGRVTCKVVYFILNVSYQMASCILLILHLDEYVKLNHLKFYQTWSISKHWKMVVIITWLVISTCNIPQLLYQEVLIQRRYSHGQEALVCSYNNTSFAYKLHSLYSIAMHIVTFLVTVSVNIMIRRKLCSTSSNTTTSGGNAILLEKRKHSLKIFSVLFSLNFLLASPKLLMEFFYNEIEIQFSETLSIIWLLVQFFYFSRYFCSAVVYIALNRRCLYCAKELVRLMCFC
jgi:hypothetical protein